ncbi:MULTISPECIES: LysR family transcriptional regulator [Idiomarina]|jgi:DNA-binding transcriptional LysR family regulator|uniref:LysR family transcriptional regulator n=2 Tax=Idiomarina TaxID=135575 RepID=A0A432Y8I0_9GAMM|nr:MULTISPECIES: LysR family transcriptional regulator [Idiomarina]MAD54169.1 LysR family transcriptional regulator [Idiomarinaceae bacterium]MEC7644160.1 LysR family transcriptional regulator [Pseudomonadota bacterium]EAQ33005.1 Transcriptional regulator, LysR family protein [Idiomarina baltica OS145]KXS36346.1 MAG: LysR family transcriptional regulator [Idiomarina sp. T82-3]MAF74926.1 LysR family transcriptional regulator [Idiomarinaceae bacterium]|tara:strand:- start:2386 stop:3228 length:843 start_codon:yes stop_codon:yes gene_type:complete
MKHLSTDALRSFVAVIEFGGITAAGERLGRSQPAISIQIKKLEQQLGAELLQRQGQRLSLTPDGERVYDYAQRIISLHEQLLAQFQPQAVSGDIRLGITSEFASSLLPNVLGQFAQVYPQIALQVTSALSKDLFAGLGERFDMILALREQRNPNDMLLQNDALVWVGTPAAFEQRPLPLVVAPEGCIYRKRAEQALQRARIDYRISYTNSDYSGLTAALNSNLGVTVLAKSTIPDSQSLISSPQLKERLPSPGDINIVLRLDSRASSAAKQLAEYLSARI